MLLIARRARRRGTSDEERTTRVCKLEGRALRRRLEGPLARALNALYRYTSATTCSRTRDNDAAAVPRVQKVARVDRPTRRNAPRRRRVPPGRGGCAPSRCPTVRAGG